MPDASVTEEKAGEDKGNEVITLTHSKRK